MNEALQVFSFVALIALGIKIVSLVKFLTPPSTDLNAALTTVLAFVVGLVLAFVAGESAGFEKVVLNGNEVGKMNGADLILVGLALGGAMSVTYDFVLKRGSNPEPPLTG